jgi:hypothetical protein
MIVGEGITTVKKIHHRQLASRLSTHMSVYSISKEFIWVLAKSLYHSYCKSSADMNICPLRL